MLRAHHRPFLCTFRITNLKLKFLFYTNVRLEPYVYLITHCRGTYKETFSIGILGYKTKERFQQKTTDKNKSGKEPNYSFNICKKLISTFYWWMRSDRVVKASHGFDPSILRHSGIKGREMRQCWITYIKNKKRVQNPPFNFLLVLKWNTAFYFLFWQKCYCLLYANFQIRCAQNGHKPRKTAL